MPDLTTHIFFERILEFVPDAMVVINSKGRIVFVNSQTEKLFGYKRETLLGHTIQKLIPERFTTSHAQHIKHYLSKPAVRPMGIGLELLGRCKNGREIAVEISLSPLETEEGVFGMSAIRDVTLRKQHENAIKKLNQDLEQRVIERTAELTASNKELEAFCYSVSHDLRSPLRGITGFSQALIEDFSDVLEGQGLNYLERIRNAGNMMGELIDELLVLSRVTRREMRIEQVDLSLLAKDLVSEFKQREPDRKVTCLIADHLIVSGDLRLLQNVLQNLLSNAWKFTAQQAEATIEFGMKHQNGHSEYYIRDNGAGFDMAYADKLFGPFQRLHRKSEFTGNGIGLATVQRILHRHGGEIWAEGLVNKGATFYFRL